MVFFLFLTACQKSGIDKVIVKVLMRRQQTVQTPYAPLTRRFHHCGSRGEQDSRGGIAARTFRLSPKRPTGRI